MMTWDAIVAISQLVAAVGVILSLIFLAIQLRQNTRAVRSASIQNLVESLADTAQAAVENEYMVPILLKANAAYESLTEEERARLHFWFLMTFRRFEGVYFQRSLRLVDSAVIDGFERSHLSILASKSGQAWWPNAKAIFNSRFVSYVDAQLGKSTPNLHPPFRID
jgi:hypothetical protein